MLASGKLRNRLKFEKNYCPTGQDLEKVSKEIWFHVSSEGEWEQVWPLVEYWSSHKSKPSMTLWFTSPSLINKVEKLKANTQYSHVTVFALSLLSFNPWSHRSILKYQAPKLFFMVRYDFFPELMYQGLRSQNFILLSATLKNKTKSLKRNVIKKMVALSRYRYFSYILGATLADKEAFEELLGAKVKIDSYDFRNAQIINRQKHLTNLNAAHFKDSVELLLSSFSYEKRIILGNFWAHEIDIFTEEFIESLSRKDFLVFIAPHHLKGDDFDCIKKWFDQLESHNLETVLWDEIGIHGKGNIILCSLPGLLCELYTYFGHCYIANGFGRSIHSVLEPFWGGGNLYCGPKTYRSTEFDFAHEFYSHQGIDMPIVIKNLQDFFNVLEQNEYVAQRDDELLHYGQDLFKKKEILLEEFNSLLETD